MSFRSLALRYKSEVAESARAAELLAREFERVGVRHSRNLEASTDLVVAIGGDGTVLSSIREMGEDLRQTAPILAVHTGTGRGFLHPQAAPKDPAALAAWARELAETLAAGKCEYTERWGLEGRVSGCPDLLWSLNDFVVSKGLLSRLVTIQVEIEQDGKSETLFSRMRGDGLILSSALGSTAYSFSSGGPIVHPRLKNLVLTPICPVDHPARSILFSGFVRVIVSILPARGSAHLTVDGQVGFEMPEGSQLEVVLSRKPVRWVKPVLATQPNRTYFEQLRNKLGFGGGTHAP